MARWFRNSGFKTNTYFHRFANELEEAKKTRPRRLQLPACEGTHGRRVHQGHALRGVVVIQGGIREAALQTVERFIGCRDFSNGYHYYECLKCVAIMELSQKMSDFSGGDG